jgi:RHS repeat-associated protein
MFMNGSDRLSARIDSNGNAGWYLSDNLGSIREVINSANTITDVIAYDAYGATTTESNVSYGDRYKYTGRELDAETGLQFNRNRYYASYLGRWSSIDPMGFASMSANLYSYVGNDPIRFVDPFGLQTASIGTSLKVAIADPGFDPIWEYTVTLSTIFDPKTAVAMDGSQSLIPQQGALFGYKKYTGAVRALIPPGLRSAGFSGRLAEVFYFTDEPTLDIYKADKETRGKVELTYYRGKQVGFTAEVGQNGQLTGFSFDMTTLQKGTGTINMLIKRDAYTASISMLGAEADFDDKWYTEDQKGDARAGGAPPLLGKRFYYKIHFVPPKNPDKNQKAK